MASPTRKPLFVLSIDTEGDNYWKRTGDLSVNNLKYIPRFQLFCESHGVKPTYLLSYEVAANPDFVGYINEVVRAENAEIGMHLHAWNSPPAYPLTSNDDKNHPFAIEYPLQILDAKIGRITDLLESVTNKKMISHRAGRWAINSHYLQLLARHGYLIDSSVTPKLSWSKDGSLSLKLKDLALDYSAYPLDPYFVDLDFPWRSGDTRFLELPISVIKTRSTALAKWLRPSKRDPDRLVRFSRKLLAEKRSCIHLMLHSSELMPNCNPRFTSPLDIEILYEFLDEIFRFLNGKVQNVTFAEAYNLYVGLANG